MASDAASGALRLSLAPAATREEELFQAFCELDHDRSGKLDPAELRGALKGVGLQMGSEQAQGLTLTLTLTLTVILTLTVTITLTLTLTLTLTKTWHRAEMRAIATAQVRRGLGEV